MMFSSLDDHPCPCNYCEEKRASESRAEKINQKAHALWEEKWRKDNPEKSIMELYGKTTSYMDIMEGKL